MDLDTARPGDWLNLRDDLAAFFGQIGQPAAVEIHPGDLLARPSPPPEHMSDKAVRRLQTATRKFLESVADMQAETRMPVKERLAAPSFVGLGPGFQTTSKKSAFITGGGLAFVIDGDPFDLFLELLFALLFRAGSVSPIWRCPECDALFFKAGKQRYCSSGCVRKANWRAYSKTPKGQVAKRRSYQNREAARKAARKKPRSK